MAKPTNGQESLHEAKYNAIVGNLRNLLATRYKPGQKEYDGIVGAREQVFAEYQPIFSPEHIPSLTREEFTSFLNDKNNHHWSNLQRAGKGAARDMDKLRAALVVLLDENRSIRDRFPEALDMVTGFGKAIATAILTVAYPDKYGVWNNTSAAALQQEDLWPNFEKGEGDGGRYEKINTLLLRLSSDLEIDLWTLDGLLWFLHKYKSEWASDAIAGDIEVALGRAGVQGFASDSAARRAIENHAVEMASAHFKADGWRVELKGRPYDLLCQRARETLYVEVKGTQSSGDAILLTSGEVEFARAHPREMALAIVDSVNVDRASGEPKASGGSLHVFSPWVPADSELQPIAFRYRVLREVAG